VTLLARDAMTIFVEGDEVPGIIVYGLLGAGTARSVDFPSSVWVGAPDPGQFRLFGSRWQVLTWEVPVDVWPVGDRWTAAIRATLKAMLDRGARVAWIGAEGLPFCDPPELFDPGCMSGGVLAWMTDVGDFSCPLDPDVPLDPVGDDVLRQLRGHAQGLADAI
jgi:hypothetical protein